MLANGPRITILEKRVPNDFNQQIIDEFRANGGRVGGPFEGARLLLLTTIGAQSGAPHTTPLGYLPDGAEADPGWANYQATTTRVIPVVALQEVAGPPNVPTAASGGAALKLIHDGFRRELALIRKEIAESGPGLGAQLRVNCLTVCAGLHNYHTGEDAGMFPFLAEHHPELAPTVDRLRREHQKIAALLDDLQKVISTDGADPLLVLPEVERLTDELESHLTYEEEQLIPILDTSAP